jgi:diadenosine hexaphosphate hydrolase (ATP-forming)
MAVAPHDNPIIEGAGGVVFNALHEVLLIRQRDGSWVFPKGHIEPGEDPLNTARREVEEEAGVPTTCPDPQSSWATVYVNARGERRRITWYRLETEASEPTMREAQFPEGRFVDAERASDLLAFREDRALLTRVIREGATV